MDIHHRVSRRRVGHVDGAELASLYGGDYHRRADITEQNPSRAKRNFLVRPRRPPTEYGVGGGISRSSCGFCHPLRARPGCRERPNSESSSAVVQLSRMRLEVLQDYVTRLRASNFLWPADARRPDHASRR